MAINGKLAIIGAGAMGSAFARGVIDAGLYNAESVVMTDVDRERLALMSEQLGAVAAADNVSAAGEAEVVLIAVKPAIVKPALLEISSVMDASKLVISIAAGVKLDLIESCLPDGVGAIRAMPNTPCQIGCGAVGFACGKSVTDEQVAMAEKLFEAVGIGLRVPEKQLDAVTGLSGSGPAYVYLIIEALSDAGVRVGLTRDISLKLAAQTVYGAAKMVVETGEHPAKLKDNVTSPGGTTIAGIDALEKHGCRSALMEAVKAATKRSEELG